MSNAGMEIKRPSRIRNLSSARELILLAPPVSSAIKVFRRISAGAKRYLDLLSQMQHFRGQVYLEEGAVLPEDLHDGKHRLPIDDESWHLLVLDAAGKVCGCARYREYSNQTDFSRLTVAHSALARSPSWGAKLRAAVEAELALARRFNFPYVELGGWALSAEIRWTAEALRMALATFSLSRVLGGGVGLSTVTRRNCSASILRRMGGRSLEHQGEELPAYYDPKFGCEMEVLRFHSWAPNPRYNVWIDSVGSELVGIPVLTPPLSGYCAGV